jgi:glycerol-3-phosphate dehydrogenase subunit C
MPFSAHTDLMGCLNAFRSADLATSLKPVRQLLDATLKIDHHRSLPSIFTARSGAGTSPRQNSTVCRTGGLLPRLLRELQPSAAGEDLLKVLNAMGTACNC